MSRPTPQQVRDWLKQQIVEKKPPPSPEEIRRQLSWHLEPNNKSAECAR